MKKFIYTIIGIVLLSLSSCSDFLEPKSQSEYVPKDANALQEMLIGSAYPQHKSPIPDNSGSFPVSMSERKGSP